MILGTLNLANLAWDLLFGFHHFLTSVFCHFTCIDSIEWLSFHGLDYQRAFYKTIIASKGNLCLGGASALKIDTQVAISYS